MKNIIFLLFTLSIHEALFAEGKELLVRSKIKNVTVFLSGAEISREASVTLEEGRTVLKFTELSPKINPASITASVSSNVKIISILHQYNFLVNTKQTDKALQLKDSLEILQYQLEKIRFEKNSLLEEQGILTENKSRLGKENGVNTQELMSATTFYRSKLHEIDLKLLALMMQENKLNDRMGRIQNQLKEFNITEERPISEITITLDASASVKVQVFLKYLVKDAVWSPKYDLRTQGAGSKIGLDYRAEILNNSAEDWPNVKLVLSTADPSKNMDKPSLQPWGLSYTRNRRGRVIHQTTSGQEGLLNTHQPKPGDNSSESINKSVEVSYSDIEVSELSVDFQIREPYSIASDGKIYIVDVNEYKLDATYNYFAIPKMDQDAFLLAKVVGWESLNLIEGPANIFFNGTYIGQTVLNTRYSNDTLELSLGRDRKMNISRVKKQDYNSHKIIGLNRSESFTYEIDVRNNNSLPVEMEIQDQVPITQESDIEINVSEISDAEYDPISGKLIWKLKLAPAESKKITISYTVKYPRNKDIIIRNSRIVACPKFR